MKLDGNRIMCILEKLVFAEVAAILILIGIMIAQAVQDNRDTARYFMDDYREYVAVAEKAGESIVNGRDSVFRPGWDTAVFTGGQYIHRTLWDGSPESVDFRISRPDSASLKIFTYPEPDKKMRKLLTRMRLMEEYADLHYREQQNAHRIGDMYMTDYDYGISMETAGKTDPHD